MPRIPSEAGHLAALCQTRLTAVRGAVLYPSGCISACRHDSVIGGLRSRWEKSCEEERCTAGRRVTCRQVTLDTGGPTTWACEDTAPCQGRL